MQSTAIFHLKDTRKEVPRLHRWQPDCMKNVQEKRKRKRAGERPTRLRCVVIWIGGLVQASRQASKIGTDAAIHHTVSRANNQAAKD